MEVRITKKVFKFKRPSGTSRGILTEKHAWFIELWHASEPSIKGIGECSIIPGLSPDFSDFRTYEAKLNDVASNISQDLTDWPSIKFGVETALLDLKNGGRQKLFNNRFTRGEEKIPINGLIWMGDEGFMREQIEEKIELGFDTIKMKIGAIDFEVEMTLLSSIRKRFSSDQMTLRVDANGAFTAQNALAKLQRLAECDIHSIEQPVAPGQWQIMRSLCEETPLDIALDEELIGVHATKEKCALLDTIKPQYIILKPSLHGGFSGSREWIKLAEDRSIPWWMTSALESNIGLNAICQFAGEFDNELPQGLGTGSLYENNIESDLTVENGMIYKKIN